MIRVRTRKNPMMKEWGMVDGKTVRGLLAEFKGNEVIAIIASQVGRARQKAGESEEALGVLVAEFERKNGIRAQRPTGPAPRYRRSAEDEERSDIEDTRRRIESYRRGADALERFARHLDGEKVYLLNEREVRDLTEFVDEDR